MPADFVAEITPDAHRTAADYTRARERLARWETLAEALVGIVWALGGIDLLYGAIARDMPPSLWRGVVFLVATGVVGTLVALPFQLARAFRIETRFGFNTTTPLQFAVDRLKAALLTLVVAVPLLAALLWAMRTLTGFWWVWAWIGLVMLMLVAPSVYVRLVAPRFNRFEPLPDGPLRTGVEAVLARAGFRASGLYTMDASRRSTHGNAFFIGFGRAKRIVLFDTLLARSTPAEVEAIVAHELGHFRHGHVLTGLMRSAAMSFAVLAAFGWLAKQDWLLPAFGVRQHDDALALFVCLLLAGTIGPLVAPLGIGSRAATNTRPTISPAAASASSRWSAH